MSKDCPAAPLGLGAQVAPPLAIEVRHGDVIDRLQKVAHHDWRNSRPLDLSDAGLFADLEDRYADSLEELVLDSDPPKSAHKKRD